ncbi:MAG: hypothetical protein ACOCX2_02845, partial [Armatimonadota bacterium]
MDQETMLHHLEELADRLGITVRYEAAAGRVGVCRLRGERVAVIDANLRVPDRVAALSSVLADEELDGVYIPPEVRRRLDRSRPLRVRPGAEDEADETPREAPTGEEPVGTAESAATADVA